MPHLPSIRVTRRADAELRASRRSWLGQTPRPHLTQHTEALAARPGPGPAADSSGPYWSGVRFLFKAPSGFETASGSLRGARPGCFVDSNGTVVQWRSATTGPLGSGSHHLSVSGPSRDDDRPSPCAPYKRPLNTAPMQQVSWARADGGRTVSARKHPTARLGLESKALASRAPTAHRPHGDDHGAIGRH